MLFLDMGTFIPFGQILSTGNNTWDQLAVIEKL